MPSELIKIDIELSNGKKAGNTLGELQSDAKKLNAELKKLPFNSEEFAKKSQDLKKVNTKLKAVRDEVSGVEKSMQQLNVTFNTVVNNSPFGGLAAKIQGLKQPIEGAVGGFKNIRTALIAIPLMAVVAAVTALVQWFKRTEEGAQALKVITAGISQIFQSLLDVASSLGKTLFDVFKNPGQAIQGFGQSIQNFLISRFELLMKSVSGFGNALNLLFEGEFQAAAKEAGNAFIDLQRATNPAWMALEGVANASKSLFHEISNDVKGAIALQERENKLLVAKREFKLQEKALENQISDLKLKASDQTLSAAERERMLATAMEKQKLLTSERIRLAEEEFLIQKERNELSDSTPEDLNRQVELEAQVMDIRRQGTEQLKEMFSMSTGLQKQLADAEIAEQQKKDAAKEVLRQKELTAERALQDLKVELIADSTKREIAKINLAHERKLEQLVGNEAQITEQKMILEQQRIDKIAEVNAKREEELRIEKEELEKVTLEEKLINGILSEQEYQDALYELKRVNMYRELDLMKSIHGEESAEYKRQKNAIAQIEREHIDEIIESEEVLAEAKQAMEKATLDGARDSLSGVIALLEEEQGARKKNAGLIKALKIGQVLTSGIAEVQHIWENVAQMGPIIGPIIGAVQTGLAVARTGLALNKLSGVKFSAGTILRGPSHSQGGIKILNPYSGTIDEAEGDEILLTAAVSRDPVGRTLASNLNAAYGGRRFATGGPINPLRSPLMQGQVTPTHLTGGQVYNPIINVNNDDLRADLQQMAKNMEQWQRNLKIHLSLRDVEEGLGTIQDLRDEASF
jgi:hypothetical protein